MRVRAPAGVQNSGASWRCTEACKQDRVDVRLCTLSQGCCIAALQETREERLAVLLSALLRRYVEGDYVGFQVSLTSHWACSSPEVLYVES